MDEEKRQSIRKMLGGKTLAIEGVIGVGKSHFMVELAKYLETNNVFQKVFCYEEEFPPDILKRFNNNPNKYSFIFQTIMMTQRLKQNSLALERRNENDFNIVDTGLLREFAFSLANRKMGFMTEDQYDLHIKYFITSFKAIGSPVPDIMLLLESTTENLLQRIRQRHRDGESEIQNYYLTELTNAHKQEFDNEILSNQNIKKFIISNDSDFLHPNVFIKMLLNNN